MVQVKSSIENEVAISIGLGNHLKEVKFHWRTSKILNLNLCLNDWFKMSFHSKEENKRRKCSFSFICYSINILEKKFTSTDGVYKSSRNVKSYIRTTQTKQHTWKMVIQTLSENYVNFLTSLKYIFIYFQCLNIHKRKTRHKQ